MLKRFHVFEFCDQSWLTGIWREAYMDCMNMVHTAFRPYRGMAARLAYIAEHAGATAIVDLASGGGEQIESLLREADKKAITLPPFILTDLYPQIDEYKRLQQLYGENRVRYIASPVSATDAGQFLESTQLCLICTALHHFQPADARQIIDGAQSHSKGLIVLELSPRNWFMILQMFCGIPFMMLSPFFASRFSVTKLLITTLVPIIPLMFAFDGMVSCLRTYTREELVGMSPQKEGLRWEYHNSFKALPILSYFFAVWRETPPV